MKLYTGKISKMGIGARGLDTPAERDFLKKIMAKKKKNGVRGLDTPAERAFLKKALAKKPKKKLKKSGPSGRK